MFHNCFEISIDSFYNDSFSFLFSRITWKIYSKRVSRISFISNVSIFNDIPMIIMATIHGRNHGDP